MAARFSFLRRPRLRRMGPAQRVSLGLCSIMLAALLALDLLFGVLPNHSELDRKLRERTSELVAMKAAGALGSASDQLLERVLQQSLARDPQLLSLAVRAVDGRVVAQSGDHASHWKLRTESDPDHVRVPLFGGQQRWGDVELTFKSSAPQSAWEWLAEPRVFLVLVLGLSSFAFFSLYLRRVFHYLDPSAVIPERVRKAFDAFTEGVMVVDKNGRIVLANAAFRRWVERAGTELYGHVIQNMPWVRSALPGDPKDYPWIRAMDLGSPQKGEQIAFPQESGEPVRTVVNSAPIQDASGNVRGCIVTFDDVTEMERVNTQLRSALTALESTREQINKQNDELRQLAMRDPLTGCANRRALFEQFETLFATARTENQPLCCIMTDIDHFKSINDNYGHAVGDRVLQVVSRALAGGLRDTDVLGRYGGEEFCIALPGVGLEEACTIAERLRAEIESRAGKGVRSSQGIVVTSSFGVAELGPGLADPAQLIDRADTALYKAKKDGRNCVASIVDDGAIVVRRAA
jgi:diguanylate cyclase (GGDEF)-like protein/PAS domain S-box-containing protein